MLSNNTKKESIKYYSISKKLKRNKLITEDFEVMLNNLSLEEIIALKLELSSRTLNSKMYGFNLWKNLSTI